MRRPPFDLARAPGALRPAGASVSRRAGERGEVTWVGLVLLVALVAGVYLGWVWGPVYFVHYEVKQVVREYMNQAVRNPNDAELVDRMVRKLESVARDDGVDEYGDPARVPAVVVDADSVTWEREAGANPPMLHVSFEYERTVTYPLLGTTGSKVFSVDLENDLTKPDWGPAR
jgi:hypothetical protein